MNKSGFIKTTEGKSEYRNKLIQEFYDEFYKDVAEQDRMKFKDFETICKTPFIHFIDTINSGKLVELRLKYLGKFAPTPSAVVKELKYLEERFKKKYVSEKYYIEYKEMLENYIKNEPKLFKRWNFSLQKKQK